MFSVIATSDPQTEQLLKQLRDIHLPEPTGWWPLAPGWWIIIGLLIVIIILLIARKFHQSRKERFSRLALKELAVLEQTSQKNWLIELEVLLKRTALCYFPKVQIAQLNTQEWINFLIKHDDDIWSEQSLFTLRDCAFQDPEKIDDIHKALLLKQSQQWITKLPYLKESIGSEKNV
ncbi:MAG: DUF4381 domain-containing protein [Kangiellaceae bacterium]|nr:DUF4381 domain-containing protein [Kangiellaceae bacterium]